MGQSLSGPVGTQESRNPKYLINLYSREFHEDLEPIDDMYLNDYGDDDIPPSDCSHLVDIATPPVNVEDEDYPIDTFHANMGVAEYSPSKSTAIPDDMVHKDGPTPSHVNAFKHSLNETRKEQRRKYSVLTQSETTCRDELDGLKRCYRNREDLLDCASAVRAYSQCASASVKKGRE